MQNIKVAGEIELEKVDRSQLMEELAPYRRAENRKAIWQLLNTFIPYIALWSLMIVMLQRDWPFWSILPLTLLAGLFLVRIFIFFHDCCHGSFFSSARGNKIVGYISGMLTFTPYYQWRRDHNLHHATAGNLDQRGMGDVWTLTVEEYRQASRLRKLGYRLYRNPLVLLVLGPIYTFLIKQRFFGKDAGKRERRSVWITNFGIMLILGVATLTISLKTYLLIQLPIMLFSGMLGVWLFYVQHQYAGVYWAREQEWDSLKASLEGSSYYKLPAILQWFTGNIGIHHIHHVEPRIPNYKLQQCYEEIPLFQTIKPLTLGSSLASLRMNLWDEEQQELISFSKLS
jgi:omega-6 fatty acid desaturase (delta-12 desaturase)